MSACILQETGRHCEDEQASAVRRRNAEPGGGPPPPLVTHDPVGTAPRFDPPRRIVIKDDAFIGAGVTILPGLRVGPRRVGAGSVVAHGGASSLNPTKWGRR